jgi:hypothetical protein
MARAVELAALSGAEAVDCALDAAAAAGRFSESDLESILAHLAAGPARRPGEGGAGACEAHSTQPGTAGWWEIGR